MADIIEAATRDHVPSSPPPLSTPAPKGPIPSSSPAFATPAHPIREARPREAAPPVKATILPVLLPPQTLRPWAFRTFTKKHNLTLASSALQALATFIGKNCGSAWREEGLAEKVLEEVAKGWKRQGGGVIVNGEGKGLKGILADLESCMEGGRVVSQGLSRTPSLASAGSGRGESIFSRPDTLRRDDSNVSFGMSALEVDDETEQANDPRMFLKVVSAFEQPRLTYNVKQKHFEKITSPPSLLPKPSHKTDLFHQRYNLVLQRLLRNESFQGPVIAPSRAHSSQRTSSFATQQAYKLTPIANLLGRDGSSHVLLGLLTVSPTGTLALSDLTGSIALDLSSARSVPEMGALYTPGMIVVVDGIYEEEGMGGHSGLGGGGGVGGTIGGRFVGLSVGGPPCERRDATLGVSKGSDGSQTSSGGGFGWVDFLGVGSERSSGSRMRGIEKRMLARKDHDAARRKIVILGEVNLDKPRTLQALRRIFGLYTAEAGDGYPMTFILVGNFVTHAVMAGGGSGGSIEYKEYFDSLASALAEFPSILQAATFVFVPGDNDPWASASSAGASTAIPRYGVPDLFTSRIKRTFTAANAEVERSPSADMNGEAVWTTNPARLSLFGPTQEIVVFRDDMAGRLRRNAIHFKSSEPQSNDDDHENASTPSVEEPMDIDEAVADAESHQPTKSETVQNAGILAARVLVKTILDQGYLSPFPLSTRPVLWDYSGAIQLYPLPTALVLADSDAPLFAITYEGCHVMNPGRMIPQGRKGQTQWLEFDTQTRRAKTREITY
ncbi:MAG: DNA-directed DNA polymerase epsilon, subunit B [Stictis urceolatum]|nr:DNA-directed DNA polymerase epsilon, subunit B [Stictis urceolata]